MAAITIRNLSEETHRALKARAKQHGRSTEAEVRAILDDAATPPSRVKLGSLLSGMGADVGFVDLEITRDRTPREPLDIG